MPGRASRGTWQRGCKGDRNLRPGFRVFATFPWRWLSGLPGAIVTQMGHALYCVGWLDVSNIQRVAAFSAKVNYGT